MKLTTLYFDAYKSLVDLKLDITTNCLGIVGINESGKSNVLSAIRVLNTEKSLSRNDIPKMNQKKHPCLRFKFSLDEEEFKELKEDINIWIKENSTLTKNIVKSQINIIYNVIYNKDLYTEHRFFSIEGFEFDDNLLVIKPKYKNDIYKFFHKKTIIDIPIVTDQTVISSQIKMYEHFKTIENLDVEINEKLEKIKLLETELISHEEIHEEETPLKEIDKINEYISNEKKFLEKLLKDKETHLSRISEFNKPEIISSKENILDNLREEMSDLENDIENTLKAIESLESLNTLSPPQQTQHDSLKSHLKENHDRFNEIEDEIDEIEDEINILNLNPEEMYDKNLDNIYMYIPKKITDKLNDLIPQVVFWEHKEDFILESETLFDDLLKCENLFDVPRPLLNIFRISFNVLSLEDLKNTIKTIQEDSNERSRLNDQINGHTNKFIKGIWRDYTQELKISLEQDKIRVEVFDPSYNYRSYYNMDERSQGCKTFISFLLTVGAEANKGVIKNHILLLDEPETHLHPSGVRFMLKELINIANKGNQVLFATHSVFMIDKDKYDRHIILKKKDEKTIIEPAKKDRIGYFLQEEVLYNAVDIDYGDKFPTSNKYNFVFEGHGDTILFKHIYEKLSDLPFPINSCEFYQGGTCSSIKSYFTHKPIQLSTKWFFILDSDEAANVLKRYIENRYKDYIQKDIFVFSYSNNKKFDNTELEDMLPQSLIKDTYIELLNEEWIKKIDKVVDVKKSFNEYHSAFMDENKEDLPENFKGDFKTILNCKISEKLESISNEEEFSEHFSSYHQWIQDVFSVIKEIKIEKKSERKIKKS